MCISLKKKKNSLWHSSKARISCIKPAYPILHYGKFAAYLECVLGYTHLIFLLMSSHLPFYVPIHHVATLFVSHRCAKRIGGSIIGRCPGKWTRLTLSAIVSLGEELRSNSGERWKSCLKESQPLAEAGIFYSCFYHKKGLQYKVWHDQQLDLLVLLGGVYIRKLVPAQASYRGPSDFVSD